MKTINILGSCVSRDSFGMFENDGGFHIERCVTNSGLFSLCSPKLSETPICCEEDFPNSRHYHQRCGTLDINKNVFEYINEVDADYIMIDLGTLFSRNVMQVQLTNETDPEHFTYITKTPALIENADFLNRAPFTVLKIFNSCDDEFTLMAFVYEYAEMLRKHFEPKKLIFLELRLAEKYIDSDGKIQFFKSEILVNKKNKYLQAAYSILKQMIPEAHVIKFPNTEVIGNGQHKWGLGTLHYVTEYYSYVLDSVRAIAYAGDRDGEKIMLKSIRAVYESLLYQRYVSTVNGEYSLKNISTISSKMIRHGEEITVCFNASGGTGEYVYDTYIKKKNDTIWQPLGSRKNGIIQYKPKYFGTYEICVKVKDSNNIIKKEYFEIVVR